MKSLYLIVVTLFRNVRSAFSRPVYFSQHKEDLAIQQYLPEKSGFFLDVGCGNPIIQSNTYLLYKRGWRGHMVDAWYLNCLVGKVLRFGDTFSNVAVSLDGKRLTFYVFDPYQYSTADEEICRDLVSRGICLVKTLEIEGKCLNDLTPALGPLDPSFLSIDVEGLDYEVLASNDWSTHSPRVICVENISGAADIALEEELAFRNSKSDRLLTANGYKLVEVCGPSQIYVHLSYLNRTTD
jgi:FkbM family methyltransferase